jgi:hydrophobe/amphiphile efflux-1 (HAE1) family protein
VPVALIATLAGLYVLGYSINTLTLFAMVLSIGIVVDDAIVVLENVERLMREQNMTSKEAAIAAMGEVSRAIIAIVLVLCAVFLPVAFLGGIAGQLYKQFAATVAISVVISGLVALTLTPALCALLLRPGDRESRLFRPFNTGFAWFTRSYLGAARYALAHRLLSALAFLGVLGLIAFLLVRVPSSFVPSEDQGFVFAAIVLPDGATLARTGKTGAELQQRLQSEPAIEHIFVVRGFDLIGGGAKTNAGTSFIALKPWEERSISAQELSGRISQMGFGFSDGIVLSFNAPSIRGLGTAGGFEVYVQGRGDADPQRLAAAVQGFTAALGQDARLQGINSFFRPTVPQLYVEVNREQALALGVPLNEAFDALQSSMGSLYVNDFNLAGRTLRVLLQAEAGYRAQPDDLGGIYVRSNTTGQMIPLKALMRVSNTVGAEQIERFNGFIAAKVFGSARPGVSSGDAIAAVESIASQTLPPGYTVAWTGQAFQEKRAGRASIFAFGFAIVMVYLILAALYERWRLPAAVVLAVPFAVAGALLFVWLRGMENDIYFQIGLVVLIGLAAKNAILIVEFAQQGLLAGKPPLEAALTAARLRFRPIVMTSLAFVLGVLPLAVATGAGAAARRSMGTGVVGGMLVATFIATVFVPLFFILFARKPKPRALPAAEEKSEEEPA